MMIIQDAMPYDEPASQPTSHPCHPNKPVVKAGKQRERTDTRAVPFPVLFHGRIQKKKTETRLRKTGSSSP